MNFYSGGPMNFLVSPECTNTVFEMHTFHCLRYLPTQAMYLRIYSTSMELLASNLMILYFDQPIRLYNFCTCSREEHINITLKYILLIVLHTYPPRQYVYEIVALQIHCWPQTCLFCIFDPIWPYIDRFLHL